MLKFYKKKTFGFWKLGSFVIANIFNIFDKILYNIGKDIMIMNLY